MYQPKKSPISTPPNKQQLPNPFSLFCWNLYKTDFSKLRVSSIEKLLNIEDMHILSLQEARIKPNQSLCLGLPFKMSPNIQTKRNIFGAITASAYQQKIHQQFLTHSLELGFTTHKSAITTQFKLPDQQTLTHINIHAINFVPHFLFKRELQQLLNNVKELNGPLIISGDFNTWSKARVRTLLHATKALELRKVEFDDIKPIKTLNRQPLDHIFYRGLTLVSSKTLAVPHISDHNPIMAKFKLES